MTEHRTVALVGDQGRGLSLAALTRAAMATTSIMTHEARIAQQMPDDPRMHMTIDELRALQEGDGTDKVTGLLAPTTNSGGQDAKRARRAARMGTVPVVINRKPTKPKRKSRAKAKTATA